MYTCIWCILLRTSRVLVIERLELPCNEPTTIKSLWGEPSQHPHLSPDPSALHRRQPSPVPLPAISSHASTNFSIFVARLFAEPTLRRVKRSQDWRDGNFVTGTPLGEHKAIEDYDKAEQPGLLTHAMLEQGVGDPLYPGIEMYWVAKDARLYDLDGDVSHLRPPFRINHKRALPGFLSRGLSLP
ncbi:hypothetical protein C8Q79DRAFT_1014669 [Trametes meyenii]|nr:hypothetical protein C8Q79DRAFT_1014669 [Trametes meyenii]